MARLPFDQTRLQSVQYNRVSPVAAPRVQPLDVTSQAAYAKINAFKQFGDGLFGFAEAALTVYQNEQNRQKKQRFEAAALDVEGQLKSFLAGVQNDPPQNEQEAEDQFSYFWYGTSAFNENGTRRSKEDYKKAYENADQKDVARSLRQQIMDDYDLTENDVDLLLKKTEVEARSRLEIERYQQESYNLTYDAGKKARNKFEEYLQDFDVAEYRPDRNAFNTEITGILEGIVNNVVEESQLTTAQQRTLRDGLETNMFSIKADLLSRFDNYQLSVRKKALSEGLGEIQSFNYPREEAIARASNLINDHVGFKTIRPEDSPDLLSQFEEIYDLTKAETLLATDPQGLVDLLENQKPNEESTFPALTPLQRIRYLNKARDAVREGNAQIRRQQLQKASLLIEELISPNSNTPTTEIKAAYQLLLSEADFSQEDQILIESRFSYAHNLRTNTPGTNPTELSLKAAVAATEPKPLLKGTEVTNLDRKWQEEVHQSWKKNNIDPYFDQYQSDGAAVWRKKNPDANPYSESSIEAAILDQARFWGITDSDQINAEIAKGTIKPYAKVDYEQAVFGITSAESGVQYQARLKEFVNQAGKYGIAAMEMLARNRTTGGIGLDASNWLYTEINDLSIVENLWASQQNSKRNRENLTTLVPDQAKPDIEKKVVGTRAYQDFSNSLPSNIPSVNGLTDSIKNAVFDYAIELISRDSSLSIDNAVNKAADHLIDKQFAFVDVDYPSGSGHKVRIPRFQMKSIEEGQIEDALSNLLPAAFELLPAEIRETASDRKFAFFNDGRDTGVRLHVWDEETYRWAPIRGEGAFLTYDKILQLAEHPEVVQPGFMEKWRLTGDTQKEAREMMGEKVDPAVIGRNPNPFDVIGPTVENVANSVLEGIESVGGAISESVRPKRKYYNPSENRETAEPATTQSAASVFDEGLSIKLKDLNVLKDRILKEDPNNEKIGYALERIDEAIIIFQSGGDPDLVEKKAREKFDLAKSNYDAARKEKMDQENDQLLKKLRGQK